MERIWAFLANLVFEKILRRQDPEVVIADIKRRVKEHNKKPGNQAHCKSYGVLFGIWQIFRGAYCIFLFALAAGAGIFSFSLMANLLYVQVFRGGDIQHYGFFQYFEHFHF